MPNDYSSILSQEDIEHYANLAAPASKWVPDAVVNLRSRYDRLAASHTALLSLCGELREGIENYIGDRGTGKINISKLPSALNQLRKLLAAYPLTKGAKAE